MDSEDWMAFHIHHYDWWMFPYDKGSAYRKAYTIYEAEVAELKKDEEFIRNYLRGVELLLLSWGWDLKRQCFVENPDKHQKWANWPIRLYKCYYWGLPMNFNPSRGMAEY